MTNDVYVGESFDEYLEHHGVPGMKWGIRRTPEQLGHKLAKKRESFEKYSEKAKAAGEAGNAGKLNRYTKKAARINKQVVKLDKQLAKALKKQAEDDEKTVNNGTVDEVLAISNRLSEDQLKTAISRIKKKQELEGLRPDASAKLAKLAKIGEKAADIGKHAYNIANYYSQFKDVMRDMQTKDIKEREANIEKGRKKRVEEATRSGNIDIMKKAWGEANLNELQTMSAVLQNRREIERYKDPSYYNAANKGPGGGGGDGGGQQQKKKKK
jgi:hypothetical protein